MYRKLSNYDGNRNNNFTTIRIIFAWLVLYGHGFAVQKMTGISDPLNKLFNGSIWIGEIAVNGFFAISGFLVAASFIRRGMRDYLISRALRIYPALFICIFISVFVLGPIHTTLSLWDYFSSIKTFDYLLNSFAFFKMQWFLPGVFESNVQKAMNGSLWTLTVEVKCYLLLAIAGYIGILREKQIANVFFVFIFFFGYFYYTDIPLIGINSRWARPSLYFLIGVSFYINRDKIPLNNRLAFFFLIVMFFSFGKEWFPLVFPLAFVYLIFFTAYSTKFINVDGKFGDISYGMYIYAWPIQQIISQSFTGISPYENTILSSICVILVAFLSWRYIEKPILNAKPKILNFNMGEIMMNRFKKYIP